MQDAEYLTRVCIALSACAACACAKARGEAGALGVSGIAISQQDGVAEGDEEPELWFPTAWRVQIEPMLWYAGRQGTVRAAGSSSEVHIEDLELDDSTFEPAFEVSFRDNDETTIRVSGFIFTQDAGARADEAFTLGPLSVALGEQFDSEFDISAIDATVSWYTLERTMSSSLGLKRGADLRLDLYAGARAYDARYEVRAAGGTVNESETWFDIIVGARLEAEFSDELSFDVMLDAGGMFLGDQSSSSANVVAGFQWRPNWRFGAQVGYRFLFSSVSDGDDDDETLISGSLAGLYASLVWRF